MTKKRFIMITMLTMVICIMSLGYAALQERIDITGGASVDSVYRVEITKVEKTASTGTATEKDIPSYTGLNTTLSVGLTSENDSITYNITVSNLGTVDVKLNNTTITTEGSNQVSVLKAGISNGDIILAGESKILTIKIKYNGETTENEINANTKITLDYTRLKGGTGEVVEDNYTAYSIGDIVTFAGSNWYVIKDSSTNEDYVTLMKEKVLTNEELGEYATWTSSAMSQYWSVMSYYWSDDCHSDSYYGYTSLDETGCAGYNDYDKSKVKEFLEGTYINTLGASNLKEINGYKIRLITLDELQNNLGYDTEKTGSVYNHNPETTPSWVYQNYGEEVENSNLMGYWTMTPNPAHNYGVWRIYKTNKSIRTVYVDHIAGVRPVINLFKLNI